MYAAKFDRQDGTLFRGPMWLERMTFRVAQVVITMNEGHKAVATSRGGKQPADVTIVRSGPDLNRFAVHERIPAWSQGRRFKNPWSDQSTMNKVVEYMFFGLPVVSYDLRETRVSAGEAGLYVEPNDERALAAGVVELLDDPGRRLRMGALGRRRVQDELAWNHSAPHLPAAYDRAFSFCGRRAAASGAPALFSGSGKDDGRVA